MYGHVDNPRHWVSHLRVLCQDPGRDRSGFTEFVPLPFVHTSAPIYLAGVARPGPTLRDNLAVHALARILLHGRIRNIQTSWVKLGVDGTRAMLRAGRQRPRRHADGGDHLPDGRLRARLGQDRRGARRDRRRASAGRWSSAPPCTTGADATSRVGGRGGCACRGVRRGTRSHVTEQGSEGGDRESYGDYSVDDEDQLPARTPRRSRSRRRGRAGPRLLAAGEVVGRAGVRQHAVRGGHRRVTGPAPRPGGARGGPPGGGRAG